MLKSIFIGLVLTCALASTAMAKDYKCPEKITIDHQTGLTANLKSGSYRYDKIAIRGDIRLFKADDWDRFATFDFGNHRGRCQVSIRIIKGEGFNSLVCECADAANNIYFTAARSVLGVNCEIKGERKFSCKP
ncbi:MAG: hypothetical protein ISR45_05260 [Rhodospirillales bacterium]|nr:hypothetical protein [Rhodospirillales bacterium]